MENKNTSVFTILTNILWIHYSKHSQFFVIANINKNSSDEIFAILNLCVCACVQTNKLLHKTFLNGLKFYTEGLSFIQKSYLKFTKRKKKKRMTLQLLKLIMKNIKMSLQSLIFFITSKYDLPHFSCSGRKKNRLCSY